MTTAVPRRIATAILNSLKGGVVPRIGLPYITVGRAAEIDALLHDVGVISEGGAAFRFIVGRYGSGKSFLLQTIRNYVMDRNFVVVDADLSPERLLHGTRGQGLATYRELIRNMSTRTRPDGGAVQLILDRWISGIQTEVAAAVQPGTADFAAAVRQRIYEAIGAVQELVHGFEFASLLVRYFQATIDDDPDTRAKVVKWFRAEYPTRRDAKADLGVGIVITDDDWYDYLKLFAAFLRRAGYSGLYILIDELVNIYKIPNSIARQANYEKLLAMYNDALQGKASHLGILMGGTPQCVEDPRRGIFSYEALRSRLQDGRFAQAAGARDLLAPVIRLAPLTNEEMLVLVEKLTAIHAGLYGYTPRLAQQDLIAFIRFEYDRIGADTHITPREVIRDFIQLLDILAQNPALATADLLKSQDFLAPAPTDRPDELEI